MSFFTILAAIFKGIGSSFVSVISWIVSIEFFFGKNIPSFMRIFRIIGFLAFLTVFIQAGVIGYQNTEKPQVRDSRELLIYIGRLFIAVLGEFANIIIAVDNSIFTASVNFVNIDNPSLWDALKTFFVVITRSFFYIWWYRIIVWIIKNAGFFGFNQSTGDIQVSTPAFLILTIFIMITNIAGMIYTGQLDFSIPQNLNIAQQIKHFFDINFKSAFDFILVFVPYKGIFHYLIFGLGKTILLSSSGFAQTFRPDVNNDLIINISENITGVLNETFL